MEKNYDDELLELNKFQLEVDKYLTNFIHNLSPKLTEYIRDKVSKTKSFFLKENTFRLELIADTNIIFSEVRSLCVNDSSFFLKIIDNPFIKVYAPSKLKDELYSKIKLKFPKDKKTKNFEIDYCLKKADLILSKIEIRDDVSKKALQKATAIMSERDKDDISFVALNISINSHGVLTRDKDIKDQTEVKTWELKDAGKVLTEVNKGTFSFLILNASIPVIIETIYNIICVIWSGFLSIINGYLKLFISILTGSIEKISDIPNEYLALFGFLILLWKELRNGISEFFRVVWNYILKLIAFIKDLFIKIWEVIKHFITELKPLLTTTFELMIYLSMQSNQAIEHLEKLELERAK